MAKNLSLSSAVLSLALLLSGAPAGAQTPGAPLRAPEAQQPDGFSDSGEEAEEVVVLGGEAAGDAVMAEAPEEGDAPAEPAAAESPSAQLPDRGELPRRAHLGLQLARAGGGLLVRAVDDRSPASDAGLRAGDLITRVDGASVDDGASFVAAVRRMRPGSAVAVTVVRDGEPVALEVVPGESTPPRPEGTRLEFRSFAGEGGRLRSVWSVPERFGDARRPGVLVIRGVGAPPADAPGPDALRDIANRLAAAGLVAVRYDCAGVGDSEGPPYATVDFRTEVADARAALAHLRDDPRVDPGRLVVVGQGTGGGVAAVVAAQEEGIAGLVVIGTIARPVMEYLLDSRRQQLQLARVAPAEVDDIMRQHVSVFAAVLAAGGAPERDPYGIVSGDGTLLGKGPEFWRQYDRTSFGKIYSELKIPVMNAIGEYDFVSTPGDHRAIAEALRAAGQPGPHIVVLEGADHNLLRFESRDAAFAAHDGAAAPVSSRAVLSVVDWIVERVRRDSAKM